jgi:hypothetical protein
MEVRVASNFQSARTRPIVRAETSSCNRSFAALFKRISAVAPGKPLQPKPYFACIGRGFGNEGGNEAVRVDSQDSAAQTVIAESNRTASNPLRAIIIFGKL